MSGPPSSGPPADPYGAGYPPPDQGYAAQPPGYPPPGYPPPGYPPQGYQAPPIAPAPAKGGLPPAALILLVVGAVAVVGLSVVIAVGALSNSDKPTPRPQAAATATASEAPSPSKASARPSATRPSGPPATEIPDRGFTGDILLVNKDIAPGTYKADNAKRGCYWARLSGTTGDFDEILDNHFSDNDGPVTVTIQPSDRAFKTNSCGTFKKVG